MTEKLSRLCAFANHDLEHNLLKWWAAYTIDDTNGGFYGAVNSDNTPNTTADRFIVLNARLIWAYSAGYAATGNETFRSLAKRAYKYVRTHFYDKHNGGFFTWVNYRGEPSNTNKFTYGNAFTIYGLAEYARVFDCNEAKELALETAALLDDKMWDIEYGGYFETASESWDYLPHVNYLIPDNRVQKTMNTHLHVLEAYTNLMRIAECKRLRSKVRELLYLVSNKILNRSNWHFYLFQTRDWLPTTPDLTVGHDIEASWLLYETAEVLDEPEALADTRTVAVNMARAAYDDGVHVSGAMHTEYHPYERKYSAYFSWWEQCEAVVGFLNAYELTKEEKFLDASVAALDIIEKWFIDKRLGGWYAWANNDGTPRDHLPKSNGYTCPYHNVRMSVEVLRRVKLDKKEMSYD